MAKVGEKLAASVNERANLRMMESIHIINFLL